jgi:plasmid stabilization system protein ParE
MSSKPIRLRSEAELEIEDAFEHYRRDSQQIAERFLEEIGFTLKLIRSHPKLYPPYTKNTRRRVLGSFPFSVVFQEKEDVILILAVAHAKRREGYWTKRLKQ